MLPVPSSDRRNSLSSYLARRGALFRSRLARSIGLTFLLVLTRVFAMLPPPAVKGGDGGFKRFSRIRHRILNTGRDFGIHGYCDEAALLKFAQLERLHMLSPAR